MLSTSHAYSEGPLYHGTKVFRTQVSNSNCVLNKYTKLSQNSDRSPGPSLLYMCTLQASVMPVIGPLQQITTVRRIGTAQNAVDYRGVVDLSFLGYIFTVL